MSYLCSILKKIIAKKYKSHGTIEFYAPVMIRKLEGDEVIVT